MPTTTHLQFCATCNRSSGPHKVKYTTQVWKFNCTGQVRPAGHHYIVHHSRWSILNSTPSLFPSILYITHSRGIHFIFGLTICWYYSSSTASQTSGKLKMDNKWLLILMQNIFDSLCLGMSPPASYSSSSGYECYLCHFCMSAMEPLLAIWWENHGKGKRMIKNETNQITEYSPLHQ